LKYEGEDFVASCAALMQQFSVPAGDFVERLESKMFEVSYGMVNPLSAVSSRHIEAVRQDLVKKRKQEEQLDPDAGFFTMQSREREDEISESLRAYEAMTQEREKERERLAHQRNERRNNRLRNERRLFEENCRLCTYPSIKSAVWVGVPPPDSAEELNSEVARKSTVFSSSHVTIVVEVVTKLSCSFERAPVLLKIICIN
jgi:hypothetical protein